MHHISKINGKMSKDKKNMASNQILHVNIPTPTGHLEGILKAGEENFTSKICGARLSSSSSLWWYDA